MRCFADLQKSLLIIINCVAFCNIMELKKIENETLLVRHLPVCFTEEDCHDFFKQVGASKTKYMGPHGSMKHAAFVTFQNVKEASNILNKLHQVSFLGTTLVVEYAKLNQNVDIVSCENKTTDIQVNGDQSIKKNSLEVEKQQLKLKYIRDLNSISSAWNFEYSFKNDLYYSYPPPSMSILTNIKNALACVPKFYVQVLHLMNKMNLPAPFGPLTISPPLPEDVIANGVQAVQSYSEPESEIESEEEDKEIKRKSTKRKIADADHAKEESLKKRFISQIAMQAHLEAVTTKSSTVLSNPDEVFERSGIMSKSKKFDIRPASIPVIQTNSEVPHESVDPSDQGIGGFGIIVPEEKKPTIDNAETDNKEWNVQDFMSKAEMAKNRLPFEEIKNISAFKNYEVGKKTSRLYIKNLHKSVTENDLHFVFGSYVNWDSDEKLRYDIRLIKARCIYAFITLSSEIAAEKAIKDTNGLVLKGKPIAVQFANSAK